MSMLYVYLVWLAFFIHYWLLFARQIASQDIKALLYLEVLSEHQEQLGEELKGTFKVHFVLSLGLQLFVVFQYLIT